MSLRRGILSHSLSLNTLLRGLSDLAFAASFEISVTFFLTSVLFAVTSSLQIQGVLQALWLRQAVTEDTLGKDAENTAGPTAEFSRASKVEN